MKKILLEEISVSEFREIFKEVILKEVSSLFNVNNGQLEELLNRKSTAELLDVSLVTLNLWTKHGKVPAYRIGNRLYYKRTEILEGLKRIVSDRSKTY